jgi:hypothetical protein
MKTQHTPGPWEHGISTSGNRAIFSEFCDGNTDIASPIGLQDCGGDDWTAIGEEEAQANIRLICAAPDLLAACIEATALFDNYPQAFESIGTYQVLQNAIAKARGEA